MRKGDARRHPVAPNASLPPIRPGYRSTSNRLARPAAETKDVDRSSSTGPAITSRSIAPTNHFLVVGPPPAAPTRLEPVPARTGTTPVSARSGR